MKNFGWIAAGGAFLLAFGMTLSGDGAKVTGLITGQAAFVDSKDLKPGVFRKITVADLPEPGDAHPSFGKMSPRPEGMMPQVPTGFKVELYAHDDLKAPRQIRTAPNGDLFVAEEAAGNIKVVHDNNGKAEISTFASGLGGPFGIAFYPTGPNPQWLYIGNNASLVRFPYKNGDLKATGMPEMLISDIPPRGDHKTRDVVFKDKNRLLLAVGSADNVSQGKASQEHRANVLEYTPEGKFVKIYAAGIRNPVGLAVNPLNGEVWTSVNERDNLGNNLVPDYITSVKEGGFYGWPWFYIGQHEDPRAKADFNGKDKETLPRVEGQTIDKVIVPDVLIQAHSASLGLTFYDGTQFPPEYRGDVFAGEHGSWNRTPMSGHELVRVPLEKGKSNGVYEDFMTGMVAPDGNAWGRVTGVAVGKDGSLYATDDGSNSIWKISYVGAGK